MENTKIQQRKKKPIHKNNNSKPDSHDKYLSIKRCYSSIEAPLQTFYCFRTLENSEGQQTKKKNIKEFT